MSIFINNADLRQLVLDNCNNTGQGDDLVRRAALSAPMLAKLALDMLHIPASEDTIRRLWVELDIISFKRGGERPGAGRPLGSINKHSSSKKKSYRHEPVVSNTDLAVTWASSLYDHINPIFSNGRYRRYERYELNTDVAELPRRVRVYPR